MAEILGVVAGLLGPAIEAGKCIYEPIKRQLNYLCCFNNNIQNLRDEANKLVDKRDGLQMIVTRDEDNAQVVVPEVKTWLKDATGFTQATMSEIETQITSAQNLKSRYFLSRKAKKTAEAMKELRKSCDFPNISQPPPPPASAPIPLGSFHEFESRKHIEDKIMACLRDEVGNMVGICGMGGVGKTTMAKRIVNRAMEEHLIGEKVMTIVSQNVDLLKIQNDIAKSLGLKLEAGGTLSSNAHTLRTRLSTTTKKTLIVIDDIWDDLKLEDLGIPCGSGCRVLLTSRDRDIFNRMNVDKVYALGVLSKTEAWLLFKSSVGSCDDNQAVVRKVVAECGGLPIALVTVGAGLKGRYNPSIWEDALLQLKSSNPIDLPKVVDKVYNPLRLSYKLLENERAKSLFLMCCLYGEDAEIPLEHLTIYAMGLGMFEDITCLGEARNKVCSLVEMLKSRFLLLEGDDEDHVKMHDVVRDVATFIAKEEGRINSSACTWRSPFTGLRSKLLSGSNFPSLRLLLIHHRLEDEELEMKDNFFEGMTKLNVVSIEASSLCVLPDSTALLKNLRALVLVDCESLESVSVVGELANLEILICRDCKSIKSLPVEMMGKLTSLRLLKLSRCRNLQTIAPGIISSLTSLEELVMRRSFDDWEAVAEEGGRKKVNAALSELESLSKLTRLEIEIQDSVLAAENIRLPPNIVKYDIVIGKGGHQYFGPYYRKMRIERKIELNLRRDINLGNWLRTCVGGSAEWVCVDGNGSGDLDLGVAQSLKCLVLRNFSTMKTLVNSGSSVFPLLEVLWVEQGSEVEEISDIDGPMPLRNLKEITLNWLPKLEHLWKTADEHHIVSIFNNLSSISISKCHRLRSLFSLSKTAWGCFSQLEKLEIKHCRMMEQVFLWNEEEDDKMVEFPKLKLLRLNSLPRLTSLCGGIENIEFPVLEEISVGGSPVCVEESKTLKLLRLNSLPRLTSLCGGIENIEFPVLEEISVGGCPLLKNLASPDDEDEHADDDNCIHLFCKPDKVRFSSLKKVVINGDGVSSRNWIWCRQIPTAFFAELHQLCVYNCRGMKSLFLCSISRNLRSLKHLEIGYCEEMVTVIEDEEVENGETPLTHLFPNLVFLHLKGLTNLKSYCEWRCPLELPSLRVLLINDCICLDKFTSGLLMTPNLETIGLNYKYLTVTDKDVNTALERYRIEIASEVGKQSQRIKLSQESEASDTMELSQRK